MDLCDRNDIQALLARHGFRFAKSLGQNFLIEGWVAEDIAAASGADADTGVVEVGPGIGSLTTQLARRAGRVVSVELDRRLYPVLAETMAEHPNFTLVNDFYAKGLTKGDLEQLLLLLSPFVPHIVEEMWEQLGFAAKYGKMAMQMPWPVYDAAKTVDATVEMAVQVNGKLRGTIVMPTDSEEAAVVAAAMENERVKKAVEGMNVVKTILVKNKLVNLIVKPAK